MRKKTKVKLAATVFASSVLLSGCGLFSVEEKVDQIDPPQEESLDGKPQNEETPATADQEEGVEENIQRDLYLIDENGYVVPFTAELPKSESPARQVLEYLVAGGPIDEMLPEGFRAVIPQDTKVDVKLEGDTLIADFSKEFETYDEADELKILQAVTYTLTQFDTIKNVEIQVNGYKLEEMPVSGTPIVGKLSRADGINFDNSDVVDITNTKPVTLYFYIQNEDSEYYVPVTKRITSNSEEDNIAAVVNALIKGPHIASNLINEIHPDVELLSTKYENGNVVLDFNEAIFGSFEEKKISKHVLNSLVLTLTEQPGVESVSITVDSEEVMSEDGKVLTEPVTRPTNVNTGSF